MRYILNLLCIFFTTCTLRAQIREQAPWQQKTDYNIDVTLDPATKILKGHIAISYFNHSPDTLRSIWMHVWPNAYQNTQTAFALQQLKNNKTEFEFSTDAEKGYISGMHFSAGSDTLKWHYDSVNIDIIEVLLKQALPPGQQVELQTPFTVKLPKLFSRSGYKGSFMAVTQWYPKPAVYDVNGWNTMPYLDQGEFYSEFGDFKVRITLPEKYLVAATGNLQTQKEIHLLDSLGSNEGINPSHSNRLKTLEYTEHNIHDFAWFADTSFSVYTSSVFTDSGNAVKTWMFKTRKTANYYYKGDPMRLINSAVLAYSKRVGIYPYQQCTVVIGPIEAGGGMEYPTITVCAMLNSGIITHEIGHNWFYGMLGTNERQYPWMDESINTFYETQISRKLKGDSLFYGKMEGRNWQNNYETMTGYRFSAAQGLSQPLDIPSEDFSGMNYGSIVYCKGPLIFAYLQQQMGDSLFGKCTREYFKTWQYKHPLPDDMQKSFEESSGMSLSWFFKDLMKENNEIDIIHTKTGDRVEGSTRLDSFLSARQFRNANPFGFLPEKSYMNNGQKKQLLSIHIPYHLPRFNSRISINLTPIIGYNYYDKFYVGAALFNRTMFRKKFEYLLMPAYSFASEKVMGYGKLNYMCLSKNRTIFKTEAGIQGQSFGMQHNSYWGLDYTKNQYTRINPYVKLYFKHKGSTDERYLNLLQLDLYRTGLEKSYVQYNDSEKYTFPSNYFYNYCKLSWMFEDKHPIHNYSIQLNAEYGTNYRFNPNTNDYIKTWLNAGYKFQYARRKYLKTKLFAGYFLYNDGAISVQKFYLSGNGGYTDYQYNEAMLGRNESILSNNILGHQVINNNGNMRNVFPFINATDKWMLSLSNDVSLPGKIPFKLYLDIGYYPYKDIYMKSARAELLTTAGVTIPLLKETLEIFVPFYQSKHFKNANLYHYTFANSIGFKLNLNQLYPFKLIDNYRP